MRTGISAAHTRAGILKCFSLRSNRTESPGVSIMNPIETKSSRGGANKRGTLSTWVFAGVAGLCLGSVGMSALAAPPKLTVTVPAIRSTADPSVRTQVVRFAELNLQSDEAIVILYKRIAAAAD